MVADAVATQLGQEILACQSDPFPGRFSCTAHTERANQVATRVVASLQSTDGTMTWMRDHITAEDLASSSPAVRARLGAALERIRTVSACHGTNADGLACDERLSAVQHLYSVALQVYWTHERRSTHAAATHAGLRKSVQRLTGADAPAGASDAELMDLTAQANGFEDHAAASHAGLRKSLQRLTKRLMNRRQNSVNN